MTALLGNGDELIGGTQRLGRSAHVLARFRARAAGRSAALHLLVVTHLFAGIRTGSADFRANATLFHVEGGFPEHEIRAGSATLGTIQKELDVIGCCVLAALGEAVSGGLSAGCVTALTVRQFEMHSCISNCR